MSVVYRGAATAVIVIGVSFAATASTDVVFMETFNGYLPSPPGAGFPDEHPNNDPVNFGTPLIAEGADNDWFAARFETPDSPLTSNTSEDTYLDVGVQKIPGGGRPSPDPVGRVGDDAGLLFKVDTSNMTEAFLMFDWRNFSTNSGDKAVVGYTTLDLDPFFSNFNDGSLSVSSGVATPGGGNDNPIADFLNDPNAGNGSQSDAENWWANNWTELLRKRKESWQTETFTIPTGETELWIAFWIDNGDGDFLKIDNVKVFGTVIPEPASAALLTLGSLILITRRRGR